MVTIDSQNMAIHEVCLRWACPWSGQSRFVDSLDLLLVQYVQVCHLLSRVAIMLECEKGVLHLDSVHLMAVKVISPNSFGLAGLTIMNRYRAYEFIAVAMSEYDLLDQSLSRKSIVKILFSSLRNCRCCGAVGRLLNLPLPLLFVGASSPGGLRCSVAASHPVL